VNEHRVRRHEAAIAVLVLLARLFAERRHAGASDDLPD
jgi:hypothetical protein